MKKLVKFVSILCAVTLLAVPLSACAGDEDTATTEGAQTSAAPAASGETPASGEEVTLRFSWWGSEVRHEATLAAIEQYEALNPNVHIEAEYQGFEGYKDKLSTQLAGNAAADIIQIDQPWMYDYATKGDMFADISTLTQIDVSGFDEKFLTDYCTVDGKLQGLPTGLNAPIMLFNTAVTDAVGIDHTQPWDWQRILTEGQKVNQADPEKYFWCVGTNTMAEELMIPAVKQMTGNQWINDDYTIGFNKEVLVKAFTYIESLYDLKVIQPIEESALYTTQTENPKWNNGDFAVEIDWVSTIPAYKPAIEGHAAVEMFPIPANAADTGVTVRPSQLIAINANSENIEEAAKFVNWFFNDPEAAVTLNTSRGVPAVESSRATLEEAQLLDPLMADGVEMSLEKASLPSNGLSGNAELLQILKDIIESLAYKELTPDEAADELIAQYEVKLAEMKAAAE